MKWVSYTRAISSRIGEENPSNTIAEQNGRIAQYLKKRGCSISEKYSDRKRTAEATEGFDRLVQDGMARKFDAVVVDSIFRCGRTLPFAIEALQRTFYPLGIQFAVVEDDFCSADKTAEEVAEYFNGKTIDKIRSEFITNRQNHFEEGTLTHRQAKYGYALSEDRRNLVLNPESAQVVKLIFQMYLEDMKIPEIARAFANDANALMLIVVVFLIVVLAYIPLHTLMNFMHDKKKELINQLNSEIQRADQEEKSQLVKERNDIIAQGAVSTTFFNKMILILSVVLPLIAVIFQGIELLKK